MPFQDTNKWEFDSAIDGKWERKEFYNPEKVERTVKQAFAAACLQGTLNRSGGIQSSFNPVWTRNSVQAAKKDMNAYCKRNEMRESRRPNKILHSTGATSKVWFDILNDYGYKGVLKKGKYEAIIRQSFGVRPQFQGNASPNASFALKILRSENYSCDILAMFDFEGQQSSNMYRFPLGTTISNPIIDPLVQSDGDKLQQKIKNSRISKDRPGLLSLFDCAAMTLGGDDETIDKTAATPFPWTMFFIPNPLMFELCEKMYKVDNNSFECFTKLAQTEEKIKLIAELTANLTQIAEAQETVQSNKSDILGTVFSNINLGDDEKAEFFKEDKLAKLMHDLKEPLYKIIAVDQPKTPCELKKSDFKCMGYIKNMGHIENPDGWFHHPFIDNNLRFGHNFWSRNMFKKENWWGRTDNERTDWKSKAGNMVYKMTEGPKYKYMPMYEKFFLPKDLMNMKPMEEFYVRATEFMECPGEDGK